MAVPELGPIECQNMGEGEHEHVFKSELGSFCGGSFRLGLLTTWVIQRMERSLNDVSWGENSALWIIFGLQVVTGYFPAPIHPLCISTYCEMVPPSHLKSMTNSWTPAEFPQGFVLSGRMPKQPGGWTWSWNLGFVHFFGRDLILPNGCFLVIQLQTITWYIHLSTYYIYVLHNVNDKVFRFWSYLSGLSKHKQRQR